MCPCFHGQETPVEEFAFSVSCLVGDMPEEAKDDDEDMSWIPQTWQETASYLAFTSLRAATLPGDSALST